MSPIRRGRARHFAFEGHSFDVDRGVFDPVKHLSGVAFATQLGEVLAQFVPFAAEGKRPRVLDLGTGCGLLAATLARHGAAVTATDVSEAAVACATRNCAGLPVAVHQGDMFEAVEGQRFDLAVINPPYERRATSWTRDHTLTSPDFLERFGARIHEFSPVALIGFPSDEAAVLEATGLTLHRWRTVPTDGHDLGLFVTQTQASDIVD